MSFWKLAALSCALAVTVAGCGGGGSADTTPKSRVTNVWVFGDSIADSGTFGYKFTVQGDTAATAFQVFPERIATSFGYSSLCSFYTAAAFGNVPTVSTTAGCTNYAVAGGRVNNLTNSNSAIASSSNAYSIPFQMAAASASLRSTDLVIIDGGSNDLADITGAYLNTGTAGGVATYIAALKSLPALLPSATVDAIIGSPPTATSLATAGGAYAQALAAAQAGSIQASVLSKGVSKVVVLNSVDFTITPRLQAVLAYVTATQGAAAAAALRDQVIRPWIGAYNSALSQRLTGTGVQLVDFYAKANDIINAATQNGLTNITTPACPIVAGGTDPTTGLASLEMLATVNVCKPSYLSANIPSTEASTSPNWWKTYAFSDGFHPSPKLHELIANTINAQLARAGWL